MRGRASDHAGNADRHLFQRRRRDASATAPTLTWPQKSRLRRLSEPLVLSSFTAASASFRSTAICTVSAVSTTSASDALTGGGCFASLLAELQSAIPNVPDEYGLKASAFVDTGSVLRYSGPTAFPGSAQSLQVANKNVVRSSVGAGLTWASPFGALTVDYAVPLTKAAYDVVQPLRFSAGGF